MGIKAWSEKLFGKGADSEQPEKPKLTPEQQTELLDQLTSAAALAWGPLVKGEHNLHDVLSGPELRVYRENLSNDAAREFSREIARYAELERSIASFAFTKTLIDRKSPPSGDQMRQNFRHYLERSLRKQITVEVASAVEPVIGQPSSLEVPPAKAEAAVTPEQVEQITVKAKEVVDQEQEIFLKEEPGLPTVETAEEQEIVNDTRQEQQEINQDFKTLVEDVFAAIEATAAEVEVTGAPAPAAEPTPSPEAGKLSPELQAKVGQFRQLLEEVRTMEKAPPYEEINKDVDYYREREKDAPGYGIHEEKISWWRHLVNGMEEYASGQSTWLSINFYPPDASSGAKLNEKYGKLRGLSREVGYLAPRLQDEFEQLSRLIAEAQIDYGQKYLAAMEKLWQELHPDAGKAVTGAGVAEAGGVEPKPASAVEAGEKTVHHEDAVPPVEEKSEQPPLSPELQAKVERFSVLLEALQSFTVSAEDMESDIRSWVNYYYREMNVSTIEVRQIAEEVRQRIDWDQINLEKWRLGGVDFSIANFSFKPFVGQSELDELAKEFQQLYLELVAASPAGQNTEDTQSAFKQVREKIQQMQISYLQGRLAALEALEAELAAGGQGAPEVGGGAGVGAVEPKPASAVEAKGAAEEKQEFKKEEQANGFLDRLQRGWQEHGTGTLKRITSWVERKGVRAKELAKDKQVQQVVSLGTYNAVASTFGVKSFTDLALGSKALWQWLRGQEVTGGWGDIATFAKERQQRGKVIGGVEEFAKIRQETIDRRLTARYYIKELEGKIKSQRPELTVGVINKIRKKDPNRASQLLIQRIALRRELSAKMKDDYSWKYGQLDEKGKWVGGSLEKERNELISSRVAAVEKRKENVAKIANGLPEPLRQQFLERVHEIPEFGRKQQGKLDELARQLTKEVTTAVDAYQERKVRAIRIVKDALNAGFTATGLGGLRAVTYLGAAMGERLVKEWHRAGRTKVVEKGKKAEEVKLGKRLQAVFQQGVVGGSKEFLRDITFRGDGRRGLKFYGASMQVLTGLGVSRELLASLLHGEGAEGIIEAFRLKPSDGVFDNYTNFWHGRVEQVERLSQMATHPADTLQAVAEKVSGGGAGKAASTGQPPAEVKPEPKVEPPPKSGELARDLTAEEVVKRDAAAKAPLEAEKAKAAQAGQQAIAERVIITKERDTLGEALDQALHKAESEVRQNFARSILTGEEVNDSNEAEMVRKALRQVIVGNIDDPKYKNLIFHDGNEVVLKKDGSFDVLKGTSHYEPRAVTELELRENWADLEAQKWGLNKEEWGFGSENLQDRVISGQIDGHDVWVNQDGSWKADVDGTTISGQLGEDDQSNAEEVIRTAIAEEHGAAAPSESEPGAQPPPLAEAQTPSTVTATETTTGVASKPAEFEVVLEDKDSNDLILHQADGKEYRLHLPENTDYLPSASDPAAHRYVFTSGGAEITLTDSPIESVEGQPHYEGRLLADVLQEQAQLAVDPEVQIAYRAGAVIPDQIRLKELVFGATKVKAPEGAEFRQVIPGRITLRDKVTSQLVELKGIVKGDGQLQVEGKGRSLEQALENQVELARFEFATGRFTKAMPEGWQWKNFEGKIGHAFQVELLAPGKDPVTLRGQWDISGGALRMDKAALLVNNSRVELSGGSPTDVLTAVQAKLTMPMEVPKPTDPAGEIQPSLKAALAPEASTQVAVQPDSFTPTELRFDKQTVPAPEGVTFKSFGDGVIELQDQQIGIGYKLEGQLLRDGEQVLFKKSGVTSKLEADIQEEVQFQRSRYVNDEFRKVLPPGGIAAWHDLSISKRSISFNADLLGGEKISVRGGYSVKDGLLQIENPQVTKGGQQYELKTGTPQEVIAQARLAGQSVPEQANAEGTPTSGESSEPKLEAKTSVTPTGDEVSVRSERKTAETDQGKATSINETVTATIGPEIMLKASRLAESLSIRLRNGELGQEEFLGEIAKVKGSSLTEVERESFQLQHRVTFGKDDPAKLLQTGLQSKIALLLAKQDALGR